MHSQSKQTVSPNYRTLENPVTKRKIRIPVQLLSGSSPTKQMTSLQYTNLYLSDPQLTTQLPTLQLGAPAAQERLQPPERQPLGQTPAPIIAPIREKEEQLQSRLKEFEARNAVVLKSLRKYLPHNSSLTEGYVNRRKLLRQKPTVLRNNLSVQNVRQSLLSQSASQMIYLNPYRLSNDGDTQDKGYRFAGKDLVETIDNSECPRSILTERQRIRDIINGSETNRQMVWQMRTEEQQIERKMELQFTRVRAACGNILGDQYRFQKNATVEDCNELKHEMHEVSVKCQHMSRSLRKKY